MTFVTSQRRLLLIRACRLSQIYYYKNICTLWTFTICMHKKFQFFMLHFMLVVNFKFERTDVFYSFDFILHLICIFLVYKLFTQSKIFSFIGKRYKTSDYLQMLFQVLLTKLGYHLFTSLLQKKYSCCSM